MHRRTTHLLYNRRTQLRKRERSPCETGQKDRVASEVAAVHERGTDSLVKHHLQHNPPPLALYPGRDRLRVSYPARGNEGHGRGNNTQEAGFLSSGGGRERGGASSVRRGGAI